METLTIAVSGLNATDNPGPGVPVARALKQAASFKCRIIGLAYENLEPGIFMSDLFDRCYQMPYPSSGKDKFLERLLYIHQREHINVIIANFDSELPIYIQIQDVLKQEEIHTFLPTSEQFEARQKERLYDFAQKNDLSVPRSDNVMSITELMKVLSNYTYPLVVKGKFYEAYIATTLEQATMYFQKLAQKWGVPVIIQEFISGTEVNVIAVGDGNGNMLHYVPMRKLYITDKGKAWAGVTIDDEQLLNITKHFFQKTKWRGPLELEIMKTDTTYYIMEINPRIPAWVYLSIGAGQNIPETIVMLALGKDVRPNVEYKRGTIFVRYSWDLITTIDQFHHFTIYGETKI